MVMGGSENKGEDVEWGCNAFSRVLVGQRTPSGVSAPRRRRESLVDLHTPLAPLDERHLRLPGLSSCHPHGRRDVGLYPRSGHRRASGHMARKSQ